MRWVPIVVVCCALTSCASSPDPASAPAVESASPSPTRTAPESPRSPQIPGPCTGEATAGIEDTIRSQQAEFAQGDFAGARAFASDGFQSTVDAQQFQQIIEAQYDFLLEDPGLEFRECEQIDDLAQMVVRVDASIDLRYRVIRQSEGWRIDGATLAEATPDVEV
ncbi:MAG: DUF4864 domain-containing protein [Actinobacteria bacterium]|nr:DUF4864 domain-containing protein [Actinomycetota bacterium]